MYLSSNLDAKNVSDEMCQFRGKLNATVIKVLLAYRVKSDEAKNLMQFMKREVYLLTHKCYLDGSAGKAHLAIVNGRIGLHSYKDVPNVVKNNCARSLFDTVIKGIGANLLLGATKRQIERHHC